MEAKRIPGKPAKTKRERIEALDRHQHVVNAHWGASYKGGDEVYLADVLAILDSPDPEPEPDMIQVTMTVEEAREFKAQLVWAQANSSKSAHAHDNLANSDGIASDFFNTLGNIGIYYKGA